MADGGQRLLDVIDDPNALESFLGGLTADTELLPSAETVDNVVASLARSLDENEYEVDSPNETLFDTLDSSSNHLTDISRSYVPSDFGHVNVQNDAFTNNLDGFSNGNNVVRSHLTQQHEQQTPIGTSGCDQFVGSSQNNAISNVMSASSISNSTTVTASNLKQISASVSNCDPSKSTSNFVQAGQIQLTQNSVSSASNNLNFTFSQDLQQKHNITVAVSQNQLNQVTSLSSVSVEGQIQQNISSNSTNNLISIVGSGAENGVVGSLTDSSSFQIVSNQQSGQIKAQNLPPNTSQNTSANIHVTSGSSSVSNSAVNNDNTTTPGSVANNATLSSHVSVSNVGGNSGISANVQQSQPQQFITNTSTQQTATVNQLVTGQTVSIPSMTVSASQLIANSQGNLVATTGQNILQQIQSAGAGQSYITMEQPTALIATGPSAFGTANVALVTTGGTSTYAMLPTTSQFLTNAIIPQPHTIQTLTKSANGTYYQTTGTQQIVATSNVNALQNVSVANATSDTNSSTIVKPKLPPQLLPKPLSQVNTTVTTPTNTSTATTSPVTSISSSTESSCGTGVQHTSLTASNPSSANNTMTDGVVTQIIQQPQQQIASVGGNTGTVALTPQQSFAIGNAAGIGQVVVSQVSSLNTMSAPQQAQLSGTIVVNQFGQPMLLPTASTAQAGALQLILRQQPTQPQMLTFQTSSGTATIQGNTQATTTSGKSIVRYVSQMPQVAQSSGYGLQQIQTPNGPTWVAVRYPQASQASQFSQIQAESLVSTSTALQGQITSTQAQQLQIQATQPQQVQIQLQQQQNQVIHQSQQQTQIQLQGGIAQAHMQSQQHHVQVQGTTQMQLHPQQQQLSLSSQSQQQAQHMGQQQGQITNAQLLQQQSHPHHHQSVSRTASPMETQSSNTSMQQSQFINRSNHTTILNQSNHQTQTQAQYARDVEQQQVSVPDSSSEPPPPKKAKSRPKSSKKASKVTLDLEQLLKQSGIMDEDLQDDFSFDFGFGSMDSQSNGLMPNSPHVPPPAQIPVINTTETPKKSSKKSKSNAKKSPAPLPPPPIPVTVTTPSPSAKTSKKRSPSKKKNSLPPAPPPPLPPPPPPVVTTPTKSRSGSSKKKSGNSNENQKSENKTASSKKTVPPKKISSLDTLLATIEAVAAAAGASSSPTRRTPSPPLPPPAQSRKPTPSPKNKGGKKSTASSKTTALPAPSPAKIETPPPPINTSIAPPFSTAPHLSMSTPGPIVSQPNSSTPSVSVTSPSVNPSTVTASSIATSVTPSPRVSTPSLTNGNTNVSTSSNAGVTRVVQTIQLTPQNQQLLRNIQAQIQRLCALPKRSETEQSALQKLVVLQQQVIATGIPVPNPAHLNNLAQSVNVESINLATPSATVPSSDTATASSTAIVPLISPSESDLNLNPVSSTVSTTAMPVLANSSVINSTKLNSSMLSGNGSSPVPNTFTTAICGSSNGAGIVGSPSVSSTASPDSTSNIANNLSFDQVSLLSSTTAANAISTATTSVNSSGVGNIVVSNVKAELGQLVASVAVATSEDINKENTHTHGKGSLGATTSVPASTSTTSPVTFSQHHVPPSNSYIPSTFSSRSAIDDKKAEEQRLANQKAEEEKRARWKKEEFEMLLQRDQQYVVKPDYEVPFMTKKDAVERLMKYHIYRDRNDMDFEEFDAEFGNNAGILIEKFSVMLSKYRSLLLKESMKEVGCAERVMLERMFVSEEKVRLEQDRLLVAQGDVLDLPPPPTAWVPKIKEMVDKELMEFEPQDPVVSQQVQSAVDSIIGCESNDANSYMMEEGEKIEYDAFGVPTNSSGYAGLSSASSADIDEAVRSILT